MNVFATAITRALGRVYAHAAEAALHTDRIGVQTPCTVLIDANLSKYGEVAQVNIKTAVASVRVSELPAIPRSGETLTIGTKVWRIDSLQASDALEHRVFVA